MNVARTLTMLACLGALVAAPAVIAQPPAEKKAGIEAEGYVWNEDAGEKMEALKLTGDIENGEEAFEICSACHLPSGAGRPDGTFPQLAGQHYDRGHQADRRHPRGAARQPDHVPLREDPGRPPGARRRLGLHPDAADPHRTTAGGRARTWSTGQEALRPRSCVECHQRPTGQGDAEKFYPVLAGQHYKYHAASDRATSQQGRRRNANPDMVKVVKGD